MLLITNIVDVNKYYIATDPNGYVCYGGIKVKKLIRI